MALALAIVAHVPQTQSYAEGIMAVSLYYWNDMPNFGDRLNEDVCNFLSGMNPSWASPKRCGAAFIGSILEKFIYRRKRWTADALWIKYFRSKVNVWGSGFIRSPEEPCERLMRRLNVHAVRGRLTLERLRGLTGCALDDVAIGDPGLLASRLYPAKTPVLRVCGIIPHHAELADIKRADEIVATERASGILTETTVKAMPLFERLVKSIPGSVVLNPESAPKTVIGRISECKTVLSSAMHGLIVADSFGIPNIRVVASDSLMGGDYKFRDYYSAFSKDRYRVVDIREYIPANLLELAGNGFDDSRNEIAKIQVSLERSFPFRSAIDGHPIK